MMIIIILIFYLLIFLILFFVYFLTSVKLFFLKNLPLSFSKFIYLLYSILKSCLYFLLWHPQLLMSLFSGYLSLSIQSMMMNTSPLNLYLTNEEKILLFGGLIFMGYCAYKTYLELLKLSDQEVIQQLFGVEAMPVHELRSSLEYFYVKKYVTMPNPEVKKSNEKFNLMEYIKYCFNDPNAECLEWQWPPKNKNLYYTDKTEGRIIVDQITTVYPKNYIVFKKLDMQPVEDMRSLHFVGMPGLYTPYRNLGDYESRNVHYLYWSTKDVIHQVHASKQRGINERKEDLIELEETYQMLLKLQSKQYMAEQLALKTHMDFKNQNFVYYFQWMKLSFVMRYKWMDHNSMDKKSKVTNVSDQATNVSDQVTNDLTSESSWMRMIINMITGMHD